MKNQHSAVSGFMLLIAVVFLLSACSAFNASYIVESDFVFPNEKEAAASANGEIVKDYAHLCTLLHDIVAEGDISRSLVFDGTYPGNPSEDLSAACWEVRTEDALCAYCVKNLSYAIRQYFNITEARITVLYSDQAIPVDDIVRLSYASELRDSLADSISSGKERVAILISRGTMTEEDVENRIMSIYENDPGLAPQMPASTVKLFEGTGVQRLFEISFDTGLSDADFHRYKAQMDGVVLAVAENADEYERARAAAEYLYPGCVEGASDSIWAALVQREAGEVGTALAYVKLCKDLGLECRLVHGQKDWAEYCWNTVRVDGVWYNVDLFIPLKEGFLKSDESFWTRYRWAMSEYPECPTDWE